MAYYERPRSLEIEVVPLDCKFETFKQTEVLSDLVRLIERDPILSKKHIEAFQRVKHATYTITLDTPTTRNLILNHIQDNPNGNAFHYKAYSADTARGKLTLIGIPAEYQNYEILT